jgi:hypothetical protein
MSKKATFFAVSATLLSVVAAGVAGMAYYQSWLNQPLAELPDEASLEIGDVAGVTAKEGDVALDLTPIDAGGNTQATWRCGKVLAGTRFDYTGAWTRLAGRVLIDPKARALRAGELRIAVNAMRGHGEHPAPNAMINTVRDNEWFTTATPQATTPQAVFTTQGFEVRADDERAPFGGAVEGWTHKLLCKLQLNGVEQEMTVFARMQVDEQSLHLDATFPISRAAFKVAKRKGFEPPAEVDDEVLIDIKIHATPDPLAVIADLNRELVAQQAKSGELAAQIKTLTTRLDRIETSSAELQRELQALAAAGTSKGAVDIASLPESFTDHVDYQNARGADNIVDLGYEVPFEMILIPGDAEQGIQPFYVQKTETTWQMFRAWSYCTDIEDPLHAATLKDDLLRPTPCYEDASRGHGFDGKAVLGVSRRNAEAFCRHVSELTGRPYRLWTDKEWRYLAEASGGVPTNPHEVAWLDGNCKADEWGTKLTMPIATKPANKFGLHDFWGNVAEWVMADEVIIRGGSFLTKKEDLSLDWKETESQAIWNETYPNLPKSLWWYRDRFDMGFRLVCDPVNIPEAK